MSERSLAEPTRRRTPLVFAAALAFALSLSGSALKNTIQVDFSSIAHSLDANLSAFAWSTTTFAIVIAAASPVVGALADRFGGATVLVTGILLAGGTFLLCAAAPNILVFAPTYGVVGALAFTMLSNVPLGKLASELFAKKGEGLAYAVMTNGPAVGFIVLVPLWVWLGTFVDWRAVFLATGIAMLAVLTPLALLLRRLSADDDTDDDTETSPAAGPEPLVFRERLTSAVRGPALTTLSIAFCGCGATMAFVDIHLVTHLDMAGMGPTVVSGSLAVLGTLEILGSLVAGRLCDRGRIKQTLVSGYALRGTAMLIVVFTPTAVTSLVFGVVFGASYMATVVATTLWVTKVVPVDARATALGLLWTAHGVGAALSSQLGAVAARSHHSYGTVALTEALFVFGSLVGVARLPAPPAGGAELAAGSERAVGSDVAVSGPA